MAARIYILRCWPLSPAHCSFTIQHVIQFIYRSSDTGTQYSTVQYSTVQYSDTVYIPIIWYRNTTRSDICPGPDPCHEYLHSTVLPSTHATNVTTAVWRLKAVFADSKAWCFQRHNFFKRQIKWLKCAEWLMIIYWNCKYCSCSAAGPGGVLRTPESPVTSSASSQQLGPAAEPHNGKCQRQPLSKCVSHTSSKYTNKRSGSQAAGTSTLLSLLKRCLSVGDPGCQDRACKQSIMIRTLGPRTWNHCLP